jgi:hypothetical protein
VGSWQQAVDERWDRQGSTGEGELGSEDEAAGGSGQLRAGSGTGVRGSRDVRTSRQLAAGRRQRTRTQDRRGAGATLSTSAMRFALCALAFWRLMVFMGIGSSTLECGSKRGR